MGNVLIRSMIFLMITEASQEQCTNETIINTIARKGSDPVLNCTGKPVLWRGNCNEAGHCEDIHDGIKMMQSMKNKVTVDNETNDIIIINVTFADAGVYRCHPYKLSVCYTYHVVVVDDDISCIPSLSESSETCNIICSFQYRTNHDCQVTPLWINSKTNAHLSSLNNKTGYNDGYIWLSLSKDYDLQDLESLQLKTLFTCKRNDLIKEILYDTNLTLTNFCHFKKSFPVAFLLGFGSAILVILVIGVPVIIYNVRREQQNRQSIRNQKLPDPPDISEYETIPDIRLATYKAPRDCVIVPTIPKKNKHFAKSGYLKKSLSQGDGSSQDLFRAKSDHVHSVFLSCNNLLIYDLEGRSSILNAHITEMPVYKVPQNGDTIKYSQPFRNEDQNVIPMIDKPESSVYYELESLELKAAPVGICSA